MCKETTMTQEELDAALDEQIQQFGSLFSVDEEEYGDPDVSRS